MTYQPLSLKQCEEIVDKGTLYRPAKSHYGRDVIVICDRCREVVDMCIGYGDDKDLCLSCAAYILEKRKENWI